MPKTRTDTKRVTTDPTVARRTRMAKEIAELYARVGARILHLQLRAGLSQREACAYVFGEGSKRQGEWNRWVNGKTLPNVATLHEIAVAFGTTLAGLGLYEPEETVSAAEIASARDHLEKALELLAA